MVGEAGGVGGVAVGVLVGEAHDEKVGAGVASDDELGGADEVVGSLVGGQEAQVADEETVRWDAEAMANVLKVGSVVGPARAEAAEVDAVGDGGDAI